MFYTKLATMSAVVGGAFMAVAAKAAADAELVNAATASATTIKENGLAVIYAVIPIVILVPLAVWGFRKALGLAGIRSK